MQLTDDTIYWFAWVVQSQYLKEIQEYSHVDDFTLRLSIELQGIHRLNELCFFILGRSLEKQMQRNKNARMICGSIQYPKERYPTYDFECQDFSKERLYCEIEKIKGINKETPDTFFLYQHNVSNYYAIVEAHATVNINLDNYIKVATAKTLEECRALAKNGTIIYEFLQHTTLNI